MERRRILLAASVGLLVGCGRVNEDLSNDPTYAPMIGREFRTKIETVVFSFGDQKKKLLIDKIGRDFPSREKIKPPFPIKYQGDIIWGILPEGSQFKIIQVRQEGSTGMNFTRYLAEITKSSEPEWMGKIVYVDPLATVEMLPNFKPEYVEELPLSP
jgi:hypothetical protein